MKYCWLLAGVSGVLAISSATASAGQLFENINNGRPPIWVGGATLSFSPEYEGSDEYRIVAIPYIFPSFGSATKFIEVRSSEDVRFKLFNTDQFEAGPLAGYRFDRNEDDGSRLVGLGDVDGGLVVGGFARIALWPSFYAGASYHYIATGDVDGGQLRFGIEYETEPTERISVLAQAGATYADENYMASYFGVNAKQSDNSAIGLREFEADAGIKDVYAGIGVKITLSDYWTVNLKGRYTRLIGDAADSPVIETEDQFSGTLGVRYKFGN